MQDTKDEHNDQQAHKSELQPGNEDTGLHPAEEIPRNTYRQHRGSGGIRIVVSSAGGERSRTIGCNRHLGAFGSIVLGILAGALALIMAAGFAVVLLAVLAGIAGGGLVYRLFSPRRGQSDTKDVHS